MNDYKYLLTDVAPAEYKAIKDEEANLIDKTFYDFDNIWRETVKDDDFSLKYHFSRKMIGIFLQQEDKSRLVLDDAGLSEEQRGFVGGFHKNLEEKLNYLRLGREDGWIEYLDENHISNPSGQLNINFSNPDNNLSPSKNPDFDDDIPF